MGLFALVTYYWAQDFYSEAVNARFHSWDTYWDGTFHAIVTAGAPLAWT